MNIDLNQFCGSDHHRDYLHKPFSIGEFTYATDGQVAVRVPRRPDVSENEKAPSSIVGICAEGDGAMYAPMPSIIIPPAPLPRCEDCEGNGYAGKCGRCGGNGQHDCDCEHCQEDCEDCEGSGVLVSEDLPEDRRLACETCNGSGTRLDDRDVVFPSGLVLGVRFITMVQALPGPHEMADRNIPMEPKSKWSFDFSPQFFRFQGGIIVTMPRRRSGNKEREIILEPASVHALSE